MGDRIGGRESKNHDRRTKRSVTNPLKDNPFARREAAALLLPSSSAAAPRLAQPRCEVRVGQQAQLGELLRRNGGGRSQLKLPNTHNMTQPVTYLVLDSVRLQKVPHRVGTCSR